MIEVEVKTLRELDDALVSGVDRVLLDNMDLQHHAPRRGGCEGLQDRKAPFSSHPATSRSKPFEPWLRPAST